MVLLIAALIVAGCSETQSVRVIKLGHGLDTNHPVHEAMVFMQQRLHEKSAGAMRIDIYPSQQLGTERQLLELLQLGSLGMTKVSAAVLEGFAPQYKALSLPYIFRDEAHRFAVFEGDVGQELLLSSQKYWLRGLTYYDAGSRSFYTKERPIHTPDDLAGLKIRTMESITQVQMVNALGGSATPISWGELYTSLQQGVVDGAENSPPSFHTSRHYEVAKYYTLDEHTGIPDVLLISTLVWDKLTEQERIWVTESATESAEYQKSLWKVATETALATVQEAGVEVIYPDKTPFVEKSAAIYRTYDDQPEIAEIIRRIQSIPPEN